VSAAVVAPRHLFITGVADSKALSEKTRNEIYSELVKDPSYLVSFNVTENTVIDSTNILIATMESMKTSIETLCQIHLLPDNSCYSIIDGNKTPSKLNITSRPFVKGDMYVYPVALASIIAKVERDKIMVEYDKAFPNYGFARHKGFYIMTLILWITVLLSPGYPTKEHIMAIHKYGPCPIHRMSFKPLKGRVDKF
jgi:ribonuclease HII